MARFVEKSGLKGALARHDWVAVARGYDGPGYKVNAYHTKLAAAYERYQGQGVVSITGGRDGRVMEIQSRLSAHGFAVAVDGLRGKKTDAAIIKFQKAIGLVADGIVGSATWAALSASPNKGA